MRIRTQVSSYFRIDIFMLFVLFDLVLFFCFFVAALYSAVSQYKVISKKLLLTKTNVCAYLV